MKKILSLMLLSITLLVLASCQDQKYFNDSVSVIFFTANTGATKIETYFNLDPGQKIDAPEDPIRSGFEFQGWYIDLKYTTEFDFENDIVPDKNMVLYAKWESATLFVIYDLNGGEFSNADVVYEFKTGQTRVLPQAKRTGFLFRGWYNYDWVDESSTRPGDPGLFSIPRTQIEDLNVYAHWEVIKSTVLFNANYPLSSGGPSNITPINMVYGDIIEFPILNDTDDYVFLGWNSRSDGAGTYYNNGEIFIRTQRLNLFAIWQEK